jgi:hypothetical protein
MPLSQLFFGILVLLGMIVLTVDSFPSGYDQESVNLEDNDNLGMEPSENGVEEDQALFPNPECKHLCTRQKNYDQDLSMV